MPVRLKRGSWWVDFRVAGVRYRKKSPDQTKVGAALYESELRYKILVGCHTVQAETFRAFSSRWFETYVKANNRPSEQKQKRSVLRAHLLPAFGHVPIRGITTEAIEKYKAEKVRTRLSPKSINNQLAVLRKCLNDAKDWAVVTQVPKVKALRAQTSPARSLTIEESRLLLQQATDPFYRDMILVALRAGLRFSELLGLRWEDIDLGRDRITVAHTIVDGQSGTLKNHRVRIIPMSSMIKAALLERPHKAGLVFGVDGGSRSLDPRRPRRSLRVYCLRASVVPIGWHGLRHSFASHLASNGTPVGVIRDLMGHADIRVTMRYMHLSPHDSRQARESVEALWRSKERP